MEELKKIAENFRMEDFVLYKNGENFDIYSHKKETAIELAVLRKTSRPHYHTNQTAYFLFLDENSEILLGGCDEQGDGGRVSRFSAIVGQIYIIPPFVLHAAGPEIKGRGSIKLLIYNSIGKRDRIKSEYPDDTVMPNNIRFLGKE